MYRLLSIYIEESTEKYNSKESNVKDKSKHNSFVKEIIHKSKHYIKRCNFEQWRNTNVKRNVEYLIFIFFPWKIFSKRRLDLAGIDFSKREREREIAILFEGKDFVSLAKLDKRGAKFVPRYICSTKWCSSLQLTRNEVTLNTVLIRWQRGEKHLLISAWLTPDNLFIDVSRLVKSRFRIWNKWFIVSPFSYSVITFCHLLIRIPNYIKSKL